MMMIWIILIAAIIVFSIVRSQRNKTAKGNNSSSGYSSSTYKTSSTNVQNSNNSPILNSHSEASQLRMRQDNNLILFETVQRFFGSIRDIRDDVSITTSLQWGHIEIKKESSGVGAQFIVYGSYDHDCDYGVRDALYNHGDLTYNGLQYVENGFTLNVDFHTDYDQTLYFNTSFILGVLRQELPEAIVSQVIEPSNAGATVSDSGKSYLYVKFDFKD